MVGPELVPSLFELSAATSTVFYEGAQIFQGSALFYATSAGTAVFGGATGAEVKAATSSPQAPQNPPAQPKKNCDVSAKSIDQYIKKAKPSSPLVGQGDKFMATGLKYNLDPRLLVSLSGVETTFGTAITRGHYNALNVLYNGRHSDFSSFGSNINSAGKSITNPANQYDLSNTSSMYQKYCSGAQCSTALKNLNTMMGQQGAKTNALHYPCP